MKISVLLPTRNRLALLSEAIESVLRLEDEDWEVIVSDNDSSEDVKGYVASLDNPRIVYVKTDGPISVTDNWNNALENSSGDYVVMLGDDDALLSSYFARTRKLIADFDHPQVIYHNALCYAHPGVIPGEPDGFLRSEGYARFLRGVTRPYLVPADQTRLLMRRTMDFRLSYGLNMQFVTVSREIIDELSDGASFYRSPFPDYYAMNHLFARARTIVAEPHPLVVIGVSPRSYGFFHNNKRETEGKSFLQGDQNAGEPEADRSSLLPGTYINDGWLRSMEDLYRQLGSPPDLQPSYRRYRLLQTLNVYGDHYLHDAANASDLAEIRKHMRPSQRRLYDSVFALLGAIARHSPASAQPYVKGVVSIVARQFPWWDPVHDARHYRDMGEVTELVSSEEPPARWEAQRGSRLRAKILGRLLPR
jgi:glycosyltransferase involved in cell wall biosynthesis